MEGRACGRGTLASKDGNISGTFYKDKPHGICTETYYGTSLTGEYRNGIPYGKRTESELGQIYNSVRDRRLIRNLDSELRGVDTYKSFCISGKDITKTPEQAFYRDGKPFKALDSHWRKFVKRNTKRL